MRITLIGDVPSKKNSRILTWRGSRPFSFPSKNYKDWHGSALGWLKRSPPFRKLKVKQYYKVEMVFFPSTRRRADLTNKAESVMDLLVDAEIIPDDNWWKVPEIRLKRGEVTKRDPRVVVSII